MVHTNHGMVIKKGYTFAALLKGLTGAREEE